MSLDAACSLAKKKKRRGVPRRGELLRGGRGPAGKPPGAAAAGFARDGAFPPLLPRVALDAAYDPGIVLGEGGGHSADIHSHLPNLPKVCCNCSDVGEF